MLLAGHGASLPHGAPPPSSSRRLPPARGRRFSSPSGAASPRLLPSSPAPPSRLPFTSMPPPPTGRARRPRAMDPPVHSSTRSAAAPSSSSTATPSPRLLRHCSRRRRRPPHRLRCAVGATLAVPAGPELPPPNLSHHSASPGPLSIFPHSIWLASTGSSPPHFGSPELRPKDIGPHAVSFGVALAPGAKVRRPGTSGWPLHRIPVAPNQPSSAVGRRRHVPDHRQPQLRHWKVPTKLSIA